MRYSFCKKFFVIFFAASFFATFLQARIKSSAEFAGLDTKSVLGIIEKKSISIYNNAIRLISKCDKQIDFWQSRKKNLDAYLLANLKFITIFKARRDVISEIDKKIEFIKKKKLEYAIFAGNMYKLSEAFIEGSFIDLKENEVNVLVQEYIKKIDDVLPENYSENYFSDEAKELKKLVPADKKFDIYKKYYFAGAGTIIVALLLYRYRQVLGNFFVNFVSNQIVKPVQGFKDWFLLDSKDQFLSLSPQSLKAELDAQKNIIKDKIIDFAHELDPKANKEAFEKIIGQATTSGVEGVVAKIIKKSRGSIVGATAQSRTKPGWLISLLLGDTIENTLGMSAKAKLLELEIKGLLSRIVVTQILVDAKDGIDSNRFNIVMASFVPLIITGFGFYKGVTKFIDWFNGVPEKKKDIDCLVGKINDLINKNISKEQISAHHQGMLCYYVNRCKNCLTVVNERVRSGIGKDLSRICSCANNAEVKSQILQGIKIMLYVR